ncbi:MAG: hypothetical protein HOM96_02540 [Rickettsiales bacterium]|jgi:hypothetical protein|nr:hypothetical protein [Rickettsiales bacterium]
MTATTNTIQSTSLQYLSEDPDTFSEMLDHHIVAYGDRKLSHNQLIEIYKDCNITNFMRSFDTLNIAMTLFQNVLIPALRDKEISPELVKDNLSYQTKEGNTINAAEMLLILDRKFDKDSHPVQNQYINSLINTLKIDLKIQPSETFKIRLERFNPAEKANVINLN